MSYHHPVLPGDLFLNQKVDMREVIIKLVRKAIEIMVSQRRENRQQLRRLLVLLRIKTATATTNIVVMIMKRTYELLQSPKRLRQILRWLPKQQISPKTPGAPHFIDQQEYLFHSNFA